MSHYSAAVVWNTPNLDAIPGIRLYGAGAKSGVKPVGTAQWPTVKPVGMVGGSGAKQDDAEEVPVVMLMDARKMADSMRTNTRTDSKPANACETSDVMPIEAGAKSEAGAKGAVATPFEVTVEKGIANYTRKGKRLGQHVHSCRLDLPKGAVVEKDGVNVASPELVFLQLAGRLDIHQLIFLGLQMCSHPTGKPSEAVTTKQRLKAFIEKTSWHRGYKRAERAVKYVENGSASVMESLVYMMLSLPNVLGGFGLGGAVFNHEVRLESEAKSRLGQNRCYLDLYYKQENLAVEYDSFAHHSSPLEQGKGALRSAALERQGIEITRLSTIQAYDPAAFKDFALNLAARLRKRVQFGDGGHTQLMAPAPVYYRKNAPCIG